MVREFLKKKQAIKRKAITRRTTYRTSLASPKRLRYKHTHYTKDDNDSERDINFEYKKISNSECIQAFKTYIRSTKGEGKVDKVKGISHFLAWAYYETNKSNLLENGVEKWTHEFIQKHPQMLYEYCYKYLKGVLRNEDSTVLIFIYLVIDPYIRWYVDIRKDCKNHYGIDESTLGAIMRLSKSIKKDMTRQAKRQKNKKTRQGYIESNRLPSGDANLKLKTLCEDELEIFKLIDNNSVNCTTYTNFMQAFCLAWYLVPQGRPRAIENLLNKDAHALLHNKNLVESTQFKTSSSLGYQPIQGHPLLRY